MEGSGYDLILGTISALSWRESIKPQNPSVWITGL
jgi:hypothetical protein